LQRLHNWHQTCGERVSTCGQGLAPYRAGGGKIPRITELGALSLLCGQRRLGAIGDQAALFFGGLTFLKYFLQT
jgi:hypothetical protein